MRAAFIILYAREGYILVGNRYDGTFMIPGGYVDVGETAHHAAVREFGEETEGEGSSSFYLWFIDAPMEYIGYFVEDEKYMFFVYRTPLSFVQAVTKYTPRGRIETRESSGSTSVAIRMNPSSKKWDIINTRTGTRAVLRGGQKTVSPLKRAHQMLTDYDSRMRRWVEVLHLLVQHAPCTDTMLMMCFSAVQVQTRSRWFCEIALLEWRGRRELAIT